jgi:hypothetical protein
MDIFQRLWENTRREYLELKNDWLGIERRYDERIAPFSGKPIDQFERMFRNGLTTEMIAAAFDMAYSDVEEVVAALKIQRGDVREWQVKADAFTKKTGRGLRDKQSDYFYRVERVMLWNGPQDYVLLDVPPSDEIYDLIPEFERGLG